MTSKRNMFCTRPFMNPRLKRIGFLISGYTATPSSRRAHPFALTLCSFIALSSGLMGKPLQSQMVVLGNMSLGGTIVKTDNLAGTLQVAFDAGAKRILVPMSNVGDIQTIPGELFAKFQTSFYSDPVDAAFKALGVG